VEVITANVKNTHIIDLQKAYCIISYIMRTILALKW